MITPNKAKDLTPLPYRILDDEEKVRKVVALIREKAAESRMFKLAMECCTKCGACINACHSYLGTEDPLNIPTKRADLVRSVYKEEIMPLAGVLGKVAGGIGVNPELLEKWFTYFYQCNQCRRCALVCPFGIDTAEVTIMARQILAELGMVPRFNVGIVKNMVNTGNNMGITKPALLDNCEFLEEEMYEETDIKIRIPVDEEADIMYVPSSADFFVNTNTMIGVAKMYHAAGIKWTIPSEIIEAANFGLFFDEKVMKEHNRRLLECAKKLKAKKIVQGECGHGWRAARMYTEGLNGPVEVEIRHIHEEAAYFIAKGIIKVDPERNGDVVYTYHDPCNLARAGDIIEEPRFILRHVVKNFVEMTPNREENFCCGAGSGLLMEEIMETRMKLGKVKVEQVKKTGAGYVVAPCSICKAQLPLVFEHYKLPVEMSGLMDLVGKAIIL